MEATLAIIFTSGRAVDDFFAKIPLGRRNFGVGWESHREGLQPRAKGLESSTGSLRSQGRPPGGWYDAKHHRPLCGGGAFHG